MAVGQAEYRLAILNTYYAGNYLETMHLCQEMLSADPLDQIATAYLTKVEQAWDKGYGITLALRLQLRRASSLALVRRFVEAKSICQRLLADVYEQGIPRWPEAENLLVQIEQLERASEYINKADEYFKLDDWERALQLCEEATAIAPGYEYAKRKQTDLFNLVAHSRKVASLIVRVLSVAHGEIGEVVDLLTTTRELMVEWPSSRRLQSILKTIESYLDQVRSEILLQIEECLVYAADYNDLRIVSNLLRRARTLYDCLKHLPGNSDRYEEYLLKINGLESQIEIVRDVEKFAADWLNLSEDQADLESFVRSVSSSRMADIIKGLHHAHIRWQEIARLLPELELCQNALACTTLESIAQLSVAQSPAEVKEVSWLKNWQIARKIIHLLTTKFTDFVQSEEDSLLTEIHRYLDDLKSAATVQILPLRHLADAIAVRWSTILRQFESSKR